VYELPHCPYLYVQSDLGFVQRVLINVLRHKVQPIPCRGIGDEYLHIDGAQIDIVKDYQESC
jgi:hypothetical protein